MCALQVYTCKEGRCSFPSQTQHREVQQGKEGAREGKPMMRSLMINQHENFQFLSLWIHRQEKFLLLVFGLISEQI